MAENGMDITLYSSGPITFIDLDGEMNADNCTEVRDMVMDSLAVHKHFVINLKNVPYMDSTSIDTLMSLVQEVQLMDGEMMLVGPPPQACDAFSIGSTPSASSTSTKKHKKQSWRSDSISRSSLILLPEQLHSTDERAACLAPRDSFRRPLRPLLNIPMKLSTTIPISTGVYFFLDSNGKQEIFSTTLFKPLSISHLPLAVRNLILHIDAEAHRFAITYYRKLHRRTISGTLKGL